MSETTERYANGYYGAMFEEGLEFQDFVALALCQRGLVIVGYASRRFQCERGENMLGAEIKRDGNFRRTGNLYVETAEKAHPSRPSFSPSGIYRRDNSWLFVIGDEQTLWIFPTKYLRRLCEKFGEDRWRAVKTETSVGRLVPLRDADAYCIRRIDITKDGQ